MSVSAASGMTQCLNWWIRRMKESNQMMCCQFCIQSSNSPPPQPFTCLMHGFLIGMKTIVQRFKPPSNPYFLPVKWPWGITSFPCLENVSADSVHSAPSIFSDLTLIRKPNPHKMEVMVIERSRYLQLTCSTPCCMNVLKNYEVLTIILRILWKEVVWEKYNTRFSCNAKLQSGTYRLGMCGNYTFGLLLCLGTDYFGAKIDSFCCLL